MHRKPATQQGSVAVLSLPLSPPATQINNINNNNTDMLSCPLEAAALKDLGKELWLGSNGNFLQHYQWGKHVPYETHRPQVLGDP